MSDMSEYPKIYPELRRVVCAAIRAKDGDVIIGIRHYSPDMIWQIDNREDGRKFEARHGDDQGFVDQWGNYMTREEAWVVAEKQGQIIRDVSSAGELYSENLY